MSCRRDPWRLVPGLANCSSAVGQGKGRPRAAAAGGRGGAGPVRTADQPLKAGRRNLGHHLATAAGAPSACACVPLMLADSSGAVGHRTHLPLPTRHCEVVSLPTSSAQGPWLVQARDLAAVSATCRQLRGTAGADALWRRLVEQDFPARAGPERRGGWKALYAACHRDREAAHDRRLAQRRHPQLGRAGFRAGNPFMPAPGPGGIVGAHVLFG